MSKKIPDRQFPPQIFNGCLTSTANCRRDEPLPASARHAASPPGARSHRQRGRRALASAGVRRRGTPRAAAVDAVHVAPAARQLCAGRSHAPSRRRCGDQRRVRAGEAPCRPCDLAPAAAFWPTKWWEAPAGTLMPVVDYYSKPQSLVMFWLCSLHQVWKLNLSSTETSHVLLIKACFFKPCADLVATSS